MANHVIRTGLCVSDARLALESAMKKYQKDAAAYSPTFKWKNDAINTGEFSFVIKGTPILGHIVVVDQQIEIQIGKLPFLFSMFEGQAVKPVTEEVLRWVEAVKTARAKRGA